MKKNILITIIIIVIALITYSIVYHYNSHKRIHSARSNEFELIMEKDLPYIQKVIVRSLKGDSINKEYYVLESGFEKINELSNGTYTAEHALCGPDYVIVFVHKQSGDTINIGNIDCGNTKNDVFTTQNISFKISKDVMRYIKANAIRKTIGLDK